MLAIKADTKYAVGLQYYMCVSLLVRLQSMVYSLLYRMVISGVDTVPYLGGEGVPEPLLL